MPQEFYFRLPQHQLMNVTGNLGKQGLEKTQVFKSIILVTMGAKNKITDALIRGKERQTKPGRIKFNGLTEL